jgi:predicted RNase H-like HicB family nuclease
MEADLYYTVVLKRKPGNTGFTLTAPAFPELGELEGDTAAELVERAKTILQGHIARLYRDQIPIPYEMNINIKLTVPDVENNVE